MCTNASPGGPGAVGGADRSKRRKMAAISGQMASYAQLDGAGATGILDLICYTDKGHHSPAASVLTEFADILKL